MGNRCIPHCCWQCIIEKIKEICTEQCKPIETEVSCFQAQSRNNQNGIIGSFDTIITPDDTNIIQFNTETGIFTLTKKGTYKIEYQIAFETNDDTQGEKISISLDVNGIPHVFSTIDPTSNNNYGQISGTALLKTKTWGTVPITVSLARTDGAEVAYGNVQVQANITITKID